MSNQKLYKGSLQTIILKLLATHHKMYGYEITQKVKELTKGELQITEGALYPALHKLEADGLLDIEVVKVENRLRKYYKLTEIEHSYYNVDQEKLPRISSNSLESGISNVNYELDLSAIEDFKILD